MFDETVTRTGGYPVLAVHRGGGGSGVFGPENTMHTYRRAVLYPAVRMLEIDVRVTRDHEPVLMHDSSVDRTTDGQGALNGYRLAELRRLDAAAHYPTLRGTGIGVPTLREFLEEFVHRRDLLFLFDFKEEEAVEHALPLIEACGELRGRYVLYSAFAEANALLHERRLTGVPLGTDIKESIAMTVAYNTGLLGQYAFGARDIFFYVHQRAAAHFFTQGLIDALHRAGMRVLVCGENLAHRETLRQCVEWGVDYIMLENPADSTALCV